nr:uncharacterized protein LOC110568694 [Aotus nancymaae]
MDCSAPPAVAEAGAELEEVKAENLEKGAGGLEGAVPASRGVLQKVLKEANILHPARATPGVRVAEPSYPAEAGIRRKEKMSSILSALNFALTTELETNWQVDLGNDF